MNHVYTSCTLLLLILTQKMNSTLEVPILPSPSIHAVIGRYKHVEIAPKLIYTLMGSLCTRWCTNCCLQFIVKVMQSTFRRRIINFNQVLAHVDTFCSYVTGVTLKVLQGVTIVSIHHGDTPCPFQYFLLQYCNSSLI